MSGCAQSFGSKHGYDRCILCLQLDVKYPGAVEKPGGMRLNQSDGSRKCDGVLKNERFCVLCQGFLGVLDLNWKV